MRFKYENLEIWQLAMKLIPLAYKIIKKFPPEERFDLSSQLRRSVTSIALNIAEGAGRHSKKDFSNFINRAVTSLQETDSNIKIAIVLKYILEEDCREINPIMEKLYFKSIAFNKTLK